MLDARRKHGSGQGVISALHVLFTGVRFRLCRKASVFEDTLSQRSDGTRHTLTSLTLKTDLGFSFNLMSK